MMSVAVTPPPGRVDPEHDGADPRVGRRGLQLLAEGGHGVLADGVEADEVLVEDQAVHIDDRHPRRTRPRSPHPDDRRHHRSGVGGRRDLHGHGAIELRGHVRIGTDAAGQRQGFAAGQEQQDAKGKLRVPWPRLRGHAGRTLSWEHAYEDVGMPPVTSFANAIIRNPPVNRAAWYTHYRPHDRTTFPERTGGSPFVMIAWLFCLCVATAAAGSSRGPGMGRIPC